MQKHDFLRIAGDQIRWKRARTPLLYELETHIVDRRDALMEGGMEETEAELLAVSEMGDPESVGTELDRVHRPRPNWLLLGCSAALLILGIVLMFSLGSSPGGYSEKLSRVPIYCALGIVFLFVGYFCDYTLIAKHSLPIFATLCIACAVMPFIGNVFMSTSLQLSYALPFAYAMLLFSPVLKRKLLNLSVCGVLVLFISFIQSVSVFFYAFVMLNIILIYAAFKKIPDKNRAKAFIPAAAMFGAFAFVSLYLTAYSAWGSLAWRLEGLLDPGADPYGKGWVTLRIRELLDTSVFIGAGETSEFSSIFISNEDFSLVDFTLAAASHKFGWIIFVLTGLLLLVMFGMIIHGIRKQSSRLGKLTLLSIGSAFALRSAVYIMCNLGFSLFSLDGIPIFSYNGKLLILDMFLMGITLSVFRMESISRESTYTPRTIIKS